jgi:hypothetical protein
MKKLIIFLPLLLLFLFCSAQKLKKGNIVGFHSITIKLNPGVTMDEYQTFFIDKVIPEYEKQFQGMQGYLVKSIRGDNTNNFGIIWFFESEAKRVKFFNNEGLNDVGKVAFDKVSPIERDLDKLGTREGKYTDWLIQ